MRLLLSTRTLGGAVAGVAVLAHCHRARAIPFRCSGGAVARAVYVGDSVVLTLPSGRATLPLARSASGARFANDTLEFWEHQGAARISRRDTLIFDDCRPTGR